MNNPAGTAVTIDPLANDAPGVTLDPTTVALIDPATGEPVKELVVPGEGTWTVDPVSGLITFTPEEGFRGDPTPVDYQVQSVEGEIISSSVTITYVSPTFVLPRPVYVAPTPEPVVAVASPEPESVPAVQPLALTGVESQELATIGLMVLGFGFVAAGMSRRRRLQ